MDPVGYGAMSSDPCRACGHERGEHTPACERGTGREQMCGCAEFRFDDGTSPPPLSEAEVIARHVATLNPWAGVVMAELDRVREELREEREQDEDDARAQLAAAQPTLEATDRVVEAWRALDVVYRGWVQDVPDLAEALDALAGVAGDEES